MSNGYSIPYVKYDDLREQATLFLNKHHPSYELPIPIEEIIEFQIGLDIIPLPGLCSTFDIEGWLTKDLSGIYVDENTYKQEFRHNRYRFTLAHELSHRILHADFYESLSFETTDEWHTAIQGIPENTRSSFEWQAYALAGLILVPAGKLEHEFNEAVARVVKAGLDPKSDAAQHSIVGHVAPRFKVSGQVIAKRVSYDGL